LTAVEGACVAAAGPVMNGVAEMTNLRWVIDRALLNRATGASKVAILNDLQAQGQALGHIAPEFLRPVVEGKAVPNASMLVVGLGTGVNAAPVHNTPWGRVVPRCRCAMRGIWPWRSSSTAMAITPMALPVSRMPWRGAALNMSMLS
jgi:glucokinase